MRKWKQTTLTQFSLKSVHRLNRIIHIKKHEYKEYNFPGCPRRRLEYKEYIFHEKTLLQVSVGLLFVTIPSLHSCRRILYFYGSNHLIASEFGEYHTEESNSLNKRIKFE